MNASKEESRLLRAVLRLHTAVRDAEYEIEGGLLTNAEVASVAKSLLTAIKVDMPALEELEQLT
jgi:hypothetical protein